MLTWSNWWTEPRSNRYHYATRFAEHLPVIFVQPDLGDPTSRWEPSDAANVTLLHVYGGYGPEQSRQITRALRERRVLRPLLWSYNYSMHDFAAQACAPLKVYHATENYFCDDFRSKPSLDDLRRMLRHSDLLVAVADPVLEDYRERGGYAGSAVVATNGCDYRFWVNGEADACSAVVAPAARPVAIFQGGINYRVDFQLLDQLAERMPDWDFRFCGQDGYEQDRREPPPVHWQSLLQRRNVRFLGQLTPEQLRDELNGASVGLIPFIPTEMIVRSFPLKAFEYAACGLPVVTVPIRALEPFADLFQVARDAGEFERSIRRLGETRHDSRWVERRREAARAQDYDAKFQRVVSEIERVCGTHPRGPRGRGRPDSPYNVLVLFDPHSVHIKTVSEHLESFAEHSQHRVSYAPATHDAIAAVDLGGFDAVIIHYSVRLFIREHLSPSYRQALRDYAGLKVLFIQDEYDVPSVTCDQIDELGIQVVYTCVPRQDINKVYSAARFPHVRFVETLTGWMPGRLTSLPTPLPTTQRRLMIGYRGRKLAYYYGELAREKFIIGERMRDICQQRGIACDIESDDQHRIYGDAWYEFLGSARATLGTESGSNLLDWDGSVRAAVNQALAHEPDLSFEAVHERLLKPYDGLIRMNQVSPKIFEAIATRTALILYDGTYSGVVQPDVHYIPLRKDFSNIDEVLAKLHDDACIERITEQAFQDVVASGRYSHASFVRGVDEVLEQEAGQSRRRLVLSCIVGRDLCSSSVILQARSIQDAFRKPPVTAAPPQPGTVELTPTPWTPAQLLDSASVPQLVRVLGRRSLPAPVRRWLKPPVWAVWSAFKRLRR